MQKVHTRKKKVRTKPSPFHYSRPYYSDPQELPEIAREFPQNSGFDFTTDWWYVYNGRDTDNNPNYDPIHKKFNNFLMWRQITGELSAKLPLHPGSKTVEIVCDFNDEKSLTKFIFVYATIVNSLRQKPKATEIDNDRTKARLLYQFKEIPSSPATWSKWISLIKTLLPSYMPEGALKDISVRSARIEKSEDEPQIDYVDLPGGKAWPITVEESFSPKYRTPQKGNILDYELVPIQEKDREKIFSNFIEGPTPLPDVLKQLRSEGNIPEREDLDLVKRHRPDFSFTHGTRHEMLPKIALWSIRRHGDDFEAFCKEAKGFDMGSEDMGTKKGNRDLHYIWGWANRAYSPFFNGDDAAKPLERGNPLPATIAKRYRPEERDSVRTTIYNPVLGTNESFEWYYNSNFEFNSTLYTNLESSLVSVAKRLRLGGKSPHMLAKNALRFYAVLYENAHWHRSERLNARYENSQGLPEAFNYAPVFSKEHRRKLCKALGIPQHDAIWKLLRVSGLIDVLKDDNGYTYSYKGDRRYAQHIVTPDSKLDEYVAEMWKLISLSGKTRNGHNVDLRSFLSNTLLSNSLIELFVTNLQSYKNATFYLPPNSPKQARVSSSYHTSKVYEPKHNVCVKDVESGKPPG